MSATPHSLEARMHRQESRSRLFCRAASPRNLWSGLSRCLTKGLSCLIVSALLWDTHLEAAVPPATPQQMILLPTATSDHPVLRPLPISFPTLAAGGQVDVPVSMVSVGFNGTAQIEVVLYRSEAGAPTGVSHLGAILDGATSQGGLDLVEHVSLPVDLAPGWYEVRVSLQRAGGAVGLQAAPGVTEVSAGVFRTGSVLVQHPLLALGASLWTFDEPAGVVEYSDIFGVRWPLTITDTSLPESGLTTPFGRGLRFQGNNTRARTLVVPENLMPSGAFTVGCWFNLARAGDMIAFLSTGRYGLDGWRMGILSRAGRMLPAVWSTQNGGTMELMSGQGVALNEWHHILFSYNENGGTLYVDGAVAMHQAGGTLVRSSGGLAIQGGVTNVVDSFVGLLDELFLSSSVLTEEQIANLVAHYHDTGTAVGSLAGVAPVFGTIPVQQLRVGQSSAFVIPVFDADYDLESLTADALPSGATLDSVTQTLFWTPAAGQVGRYTSRLTARDRRGNSTSATLSWTVFPGENTPVADLFQYAGPSPSSPHLQPKLIHILSGATEGVTREGNHVIVKHATNDAAVLRIVGLRGEQVYHGPFGILPLLPVGHYFMETPGDRGHLIVLPRDYNGSSFMGSMGDSPDDVEGQKRTAIFRPAWRRLGTTISWADIEPVRGTYNWTQLDRWVASNRTNNGKIVMMLMDVLPSWLQGATEATFITEFARYARDYVRRNRSRFDVLEPFNEPSLVGLKLGGLRGVDPGDSYQGALLMSRAYAAAAAAIRAEGGPVVQLAGPTWEGMVPPFDRMQAVMGAAGLASSVTAGDFHDYVMGRRQPDGPRQGAYYNVRETVEIVRANTGRAPFFVSEIGLHGVSVLGFQSDPAQAALEPYGISGLSWGLGFRRTLVSTIMYHGGGATAVLPHDFISGARLEICGWEPAAGSKGRGFKPQVTAFAMACYWLDRAVPVTQSVLQERLHVYSVQRPGGESLVFAWVPESQSLPMESTRLATLLQGGDVRVHDIFGREFMPSAFGEEPILFRSSTLTPELLAQRVLALENISCNGVIDAPAEECDCNNLAGATCESLGYGSGSLGCSPTNTFDVSRCEFSHPKTLLTAQYLLDESGGTLVRDASDRNVPAQLITPYLAQSWVDSTRGRVLHFEGVASSIPREFLVISNRTSQVLPALGGSFTMSLWVKLGTRTPSHWMGLMSSERYGQSGFRFGILNSGQLCWWTSQGGGDISLTSPAVLSQGEWHHLAVSYQPTGARMYIDGKLAASAANTGYYPAAADILLGHAIDGAGVDPFRGEIDDIRFYSRALSATEIGRIATQ